MTAPEDTPSRPNPIRFAVGIPVPEEPELDEDGYDDADLQWADERIYERACEDA